MTRRQMLKLVAASAPGAYLPQAFVQAADADAEAAAKAAGAAPTTTPPPTTAVVLPPAPAHIPAPTGFGVAAGPFRPTWESLAANYQVPGWYRDAKFGIWAHWGPQCRPEMGDWYAQKRYQSNNAVYKFHVQKYGHPSKFGFKDVINEWKAEKWEPEKLIALYKKAGAKFFAAMANHHDNLDMWDSTYQPWNSVAVGPKKNIIAGWEKAARAAGLRFAISCRGDRAWDWMKVSQGSDREGPLASIPYDGLLSKADGEGIYGTRPWKVYGEGPSTIAANQARGQFGGARDVRPYTAEDIRFTSRGDLLYAFVLAWPEGGKVTIKSLAEGSKNYPETIAKVELLGSPAPVAFSRDASGLVVTLPEPRPNDYAYALKIIRQS